MPETAWILAHRGEQLGQRVDVLDGQQGSPFLWVGGAERDDKAIGASFGGEATQHGHDAYGRHADGLGVDTQADRFRQHLGRTLDALIIEKRLAHPHEDNAPHTVGRVAANVRHLIDDFPRSQIPLEAESTGGAEDAAHGTADLRTDADDVFLMAGPVQQRNPHGLEDLGTVPSKEVLGEAVRRRHHLFEQRQARHARGFLDQAQEPLRHLRQSRRDFVAAPLQHRCLEAPSQAQRHAQAGEPGVQPLGGVFLEQRDASESVSMAAPPISASVAQPCPGHKGKREFQGVSVQSRKRERRASRRGVSVAHASGSKSIRRLCFRAFERSPEKCVAPDRADFWRASCIVLAGGVDSRFAQAVRSPEKKDAATCAARVQHHKLIWKVGLGGVCPRSLIVLSRGVDGVRRGCDGSVRPRWVATGSDGLEPLLGADGFRTTVLLDLARANYLGSTDINWLIGVHKRLRADGGRLVLHSLSPWLREVADLLHLPSLLHARPRRDGPPLPWREGTFCFRGRPDLQSPASILTPAPRRLSSLAAGQFPPWGWPRTGLLAGAGVPALICGYRALYRINSSEGRLRGRVLAIVGMIWGGLSTVLTVGLFVMLVFLHLNARSNQATCANNLRQVGMALVQYRDNNQNAFPAATRRGAALPVDQRLSWMTTILPFLDNRPNHPSPWQTSAGNFDPDQPGNAAKNADLTRPFLSRYVCPSWENMPVHLRQDDFLHRSGRRWSRRPHLANQ